MPSTRSAAAKTDAAEPAAGSKHELKEGTSPLAKRAKTDDDMEQKTIEESFGTGGVATKDNDDSKNGGAADADKKEQKSIKDSLEVEKDEPAEENGHSKEESKPSKADHKSSKEEEPSKKSEALKSDVTKNNAAEGGAVEEGGRDGQVPSSILEKGIIYFFFRGRVGIDEPSSVDDVARSYIVLRPIDKDAKLGDGKIGDAGNSRLVAVPKKVLPRSGKDRWLAFVEKSDATFQTLKDEFLASSDYTTKTAGMRHSPAATPIGEGIYAITTTGRESHLAYILTIPSKLGEVQEEIGLRERGSFTLSTRNPKYEAPAFARLPQEPEFSQEIIDEFRSLRWMPLQPKHLNFANAQFLLIGESAGIDKAVEPQKEDEKDDSKEKPLEELEQLEDEDTKRMEGLQGDASAAIFADLEVNAKDYPKLQTTF